MKFSISAASFDNDLDDDYNWDEGDEGPEGGEGGMVNEDEDLPTIDSKSGRVMSKPRKSGFEWLLGVKTSGFTPGQRQDVTAKKGKKDRKYEREPEEEEFAESEEYEEELTEEDWDEDQTEARYAPINTKITITKVNFSFLRWLMNRVRTLER